MSFLGNLFGGDSPQINYRPPGFTAGGLNASFTNDNRYVVSGGAARNQVISGIQRTFGNEAQAYRSQLQQWAPGFSALRKNLLSTLSGQNAANLSDLRGNLAQRRILGSSFASDAIARQESQYNQDVANITSQTYLQELAASNQLTQQMYQAARSRYTTKLGEMNLETQLAADLTGRAIPVLEQAAQSQAQLDAQNSAGAGQFFGNLLNTGVKLATAFL